MDKAKVRKILIPALGTMPALLLVGNPYASSEQGEQVSGSDGDQSSKPAGQGTTPAPSHSKLPGASGEEMQSLQGKIDTITKQLGEVDAKKIEQRVTKIEGDNAIIQILLLVAGIVGFIALFLGIWTAFFKKQRKSAASKTTTSSGLKGERYASADDVLRLQKEVVHLQEEIKHLQYQTQKPGGDSTVAPPPVVSAPQEEMPAYMDFVVAYNNMEQQRLSGFQLREVRKAFAEKFHVRAFSCANYEQRMNQPSLPPVFEDQPTLADGSFWAMPLSNGGYAVVPSTKTYEARLHSEGGMKETFESNFEFGKTYDVIRVIRPAIFREGWECVKRGKLELRN